MIKQHMPEAIKARLRRLRATIVQEETRTERGYRFYLKHRYRVDKPRGYPETRRENAVLQTCQEWQDATKQVETLGIPQHSDLPKNWDSLVALGAILKRTEPTANILDAGAELYSVILPSLFLYGYTNLTGINLVFDQPVKRGPIWYEYGDITNTGFDANTFHAITCLSVIEHGVDLRAYFREIARILKYGGVVITSTDYYSERIDTRDQTAYQVPIHIFDKDEITAALAIAGEYGLELTEPLHLDGLEKPVKWKEFDLDYTFLIFTLRKVSQTV